MSDNNIHVLLIEDNPRDAELFMAMLEQSTLFNYKVDTADRLKEATIYLRKDRPDLILLDLFLPES